jgi:hypothetical protein
MKLNKEARMEQRLNWIMFKLRTHGYQSDYIQTEIENIKANRFDLLDLNTLQVILDLGIQSEFKKLLK